MANATDLISEYRLMVSDSDLPGEMQWSYDAVQIEHRDGSCYRLLGRKDDHIFSQIASTQDFYEREVLDLISYLPMGDHDVFVDVGANIGNHTLFFAGPLKRSVYAFEPQLENLANLAANLDANEVDGQVEVFDFALGAEPGSARLEQRIAGNSGTFFTIASNFDGVDDVQVHRLDDVIAGSPARLGLLKVDVEGNEVSVLHGAQRLLRRDLPYVVIEAHDGLAYRRILERLVPLGYVCIAVIGWSDNYVFAPPWAPIQELWSLVSFSQARSQHREILQLLRGHFGT